jgi:hypothetical protein
MVSRFRNICALAKVHLPPVASESREETEPQRGIAPPAAPKPL